MSTSSEGHRAAMSALDRIVDGQLGRTAEETQREINTAAASARRERQPVSQDSPVDAFRSQLDAAIARQGWQSISLTGYDR